MKRWAMININTVTFVTEQDDQPIVSGVWVECPPNVGPGWTYDGTNFNEPVPVTLPPVITKVAMISRFTPDEYVGIVGATKTDVEVQAWYDLFQAANVVDLSDQRTIAGINSFVGKNLLTQARADAILTDPVQDNERP
jgi:hypothetical protein